MHSAAVQRFTYHPEPTGYSRGADQPVSQMFARLALQFVLCRGREDIFFDLMALLPQFVDIEHLAALLSHTPKKHTQKTGQLAITNLLLLKKTMEQIPNVIEVCNRCESVTLRTIVKSLSSPSLKAIQEQIDRVLSGTAKDDNAQTHVNVVQPTQLLPHAKAVLSSSAHNWYGR